MVKFSSLQELHECESKEVEKLIKKYGELKIDKKVYCKYCCKNVKPQINYYEGIIQCSECNYGLAQIKDVIKSGSYKKYEEKITLDFNRMIKYLESIRNKTQKPTGKDEYGIVPYICPICKERQATVWKGNKEGCNICDKNGKI